MSYIVAVALESQAPERTWQQYRFSGRLIPAAVAASLVPMFQRWRDYVHPIFSNGDLIGVWTSDLMTDRRWRRLREAAEPLLVSEADTEDVYVLSLTKHGLHIPRQNVERAHGVLKELGVIDIERDEEGYDGVALVLRRGKPLASVAMLLEIDLETLEQTSPSRKKHLLNSLLQEMRRIDPSFPPAN